MPLALLTSCELFYGDGDAGGVCPHENNGECDEPEGTGLCPHDSDPEDCELARAVPEWDSVLIVGGSFDGRTVDAFEMMRTELTVADYRACVNASACREPEVTSLSPSWGSTGTDAHPVNGVDFNQAQAYCEWAGGWLPTEWEWAWAARGREEGRTYPWGESAPTCSVAVMASSRGELGCGEYRTWPVGSKPSGASRDGLQDMGGNVSEWTQKDRVIVTETDRALRGGSWLNEAEDGFRVDSRDPVDPSSQGGSIGFRCARAPGS